jgi:DNA repair protein RecO (recombination protein O)
MEQSRAILLRKIPWSETSLIVTWLSEEHGTVRTTARGARKPGSALAGRLDLFYQLEISFAPNRRGGDLHELREASLSQVFDAARAGSAGFYLAAYFADLAGHCTPPMQPSPEVFDLLVRGLDFLQRKEATVAALLHFEKELSRILGVHDPRGLVSGRDGLDSLGGGTLVSRAEALKFLR